MRSDEIHKTVVFKGVTYQCRLIESLGGLFIEPVKCEGDVLYIEPCVKI